MYDWRPLVKQLSSTAQHVKKFDEVRNSRNLGSQGHGSGRSCSMKRLERFSLCLSTHSLWASHTSSKQAAVCSATQAAGISRAKWEWCQSIRKTRFLLPWPWCHPTATSRAGHWAWKPSVQRWGWADMPCGGVAVIGPEIWCQGSWEERDGGNNVYWAHIICQKPDTYKLI